MQTSGDQRREIAKLYPRHCERSEAIHCHLTHGKMDCFAALAMTAGEVARGTEGPVARMSAAISGTGVGCVPGYRCAHPGYEASSNLKTPASTRQRNSGESGGGASSGVQPVNFSSA
jgi:hypothetical protein